MSYALLGNIAFDLLNAPTQFDEKHKATFAEHSVLSGRPRLQAMGNNLTELNLQLRLHHQLGAVEKRYQALIRAKENQQALALVLGFSQFKGHFVIIEVNSQVLFTDKHGNALAREVSLVLREFVGEIEQANIGAAIQLGTNSPLGSLLPKKAIDMLNQTKQLVTKGVQVYRQTRQVINQVRDTVTLMRALKDNPLEALALLPDAVGKLGYSLNDLGEILGVSASFNTLTQGIAGCATFMRDMGEIAENLTYLQSHFEQGLRADSLGEWFDFGITALDNATTTVQRLAEPVANMTAWIALRADTPTTNEVH